MSKVACGRGGAWLMALLLLLPAAQGPAQAGPSRARGVRVVVAAAHLRVMDGDSAEIHWSAADVETVRVLGIDTPELRPRASFDGPRLDPRGAEARGFARGAFATAARVELLRSGHLDRYGRTLGYFFLDGRNYSVLVLEAGMARETISRYGDNGLPDQAREVMRAAGRNATRPARRGR